MARFGIRVERAIGVPIPTLRAIARRLGKDHALALQLWRSGIHEARLLATMVDDPSRVAPEQMEVWVADADSWDLVDGCCGNLFDKTPWALEKAVEWSEREEEFVKRAGFALVAELAADRRRPDGEFHRFLPLIEKGATDDRNFVKKAVSWALRQIGKRSHQLNEMAVQTALEIQRKDSRAARWVTSDALRELRSEKVQARLR